MKKLILSLVAVLSLLSPLAMAMPAGADASPAKPAIPLCNAKILTFPAWYNGLNCSGLDGSPKLTSLNDIWKIVLNILEDVIQIMGYVTVGFMIWGGIKYTKSQGAPDQITEAKNTILQAAVGLGIILASVAIVNFVNASIK